MYKLLMCLLLTAGLSVIHSAYSQAELRDPFISIIELEKRKVTEQKVVDLSNAFLKGIIWSEAKAVAIINNDLVLTGDTWRDFTIEKIDKENVSLRFEEGLYTLSLETQEDGKTQEAVPKAGGLALPEDYADIRQDIPLYGEGQEIK